MGDMYQNGDLDTRSVVTIVLLNGLDDSAFAGIENQLSDEDVYKRQASIRACR